MTRSLRVALAAILFTITGYAQDPWAAVQAVRDGQRVRVGTASQRHDGRLIRVTHDTVVVESPGGSMTVSRADVRRVSVQSPSRRTRNTLIGTGVGLAVGLVIYGTLGTLFRNEGSDDTELWLIPTTAAGAAIGAAAPTGRMKKIYDSGRR